jgi:hypothetical protein
MTIFVVLMFGILLTVGGGILAYNIYTIFVMQEEFKNSSPQDIFMTCYYQIRKQREEQWTTSSDTN